MVKYVFASYGIQIFDTTRAFITLNYAGQPFDYDGNVVTIITANGLPNYVASPPRATPQPTIPVQVADLIYLVTS